MNTSRGAKTKAPATDAIPSTIAVLPITPSDVSSSCIAFWSLCPCEVLTMPVELSAGDVLSRVVCSVEAEVRTSSFVDTVVDVKKTSIVQLACIGLKL